MPEAKANREKVRKEESAFGAFLNDAAMHIRYTAEDTVNLGIGLADDLTDLMGLKPKKDIPFVNFIKDKKWSKRRQANLKVKQLEYQRRDQAKCLKKHIKRLGL